MIQISQLAADVRRFGVIQAELELLLGRRCAKPADKILRGADSFEDWVGPLIRIDALEYVSLRRLGGETARTRIAEFVRERPGRTVRIRALAALLSHELSAEVETHLLERLMERRGILFADGIISDEAFPMRRVLPRMVEDFQAFEKLRHMPAINGWWERSPDGESLENIRRHLRLGMPGDLSLGDVRELLERRAIPTRGEFVPEFAFSELVRAALDRDVAELSRLRASADTTHQVRGFFRVLPGRR